MPFLRLLSAVPPYRVAREGAPGIRPTDKHSKVIPCVPAGNALSTTAGKHWDCIRTRLHPASCRCAQCSYKYTVWHRIRTARIHGEGTFGWRLNTPFDGVLNTCLSQSLQSMSLCLHTIVA
jgi:hypothetical protein